jgi:hypothetical protein
MKGFPSEKPESMINCVNKLAMVPASKIYWSHHSSGKNFTREQRGWELQSVISQYYWYFYSTEY